MSASAPSPSPASEHLDDPRPNPELARPSSYAAVPGWMVSGILHAGVIVFLVTSGLPSCGDGQYGTGAEQGDFREVGIYVKQPNESPQKPDEAKDSETEEAQTPTAESAATKTAPAAEAAPTELIDLPDVKPRAVIGQSRGGGSPEISVPGAAEALVTPNAVAAPTSKGQGPGSVSFMGQTTVADSVVYVIDTSSSMRVNNAMSYAAAKLKQSINGLSPKQQFQIIAYSDVPTVMRLTNNRSGAPALYRAIGPNVTLAARYINSMVAIGGTKHWPAVQQAFGFQPDVIFLLTDADTALSPRELSEIKTKLNKKGKTHIHCIQFGEGPDLKSASGNFLRTLASENRGTYTYIDTSQLEGP